MGYADGIPAPDDFKAQKAKALDDAQERTKRRGVQVYTSKESHVESALHMISCSACHKLAFICSEPLSKQPKRGTDHSSVMKSSILAKSMMVEGERKMIKRAKGVEKQYRWLCPGDGCGLALCYQSQPFESEAKHIFVLEGAVEEDNSETIDKSTGGRKYDTSGVSYDRGVIGF